MSEFFPIIELVDRYVIAKIKKDKGLPNIEEFSWYNTQLKKIDSSKIVDDLTALEKIHLSIWELEALLKSGKEYLLSLEEIGKRAIEIRNLNNERIKLKNAMAEKLNCKVREIKKEHLSE